MRWLKLHCCNVRRGLTAISMLFLASCAHAPEYSLTDLDLYRSSSLAGLHAHPRNFEGYKLDVTEQRFNDRRAIIREWLVMREGAEMLDTIDKSIDEQVHGIYWIGSPEVEDEWSSIRFAKQDLRELERRKRLAESGGK